MLQELYFQFFQFLNLDLLILVFCALGLSLLIDRISGYRVVKTFFILTAMIFGVVWGSVATLPGFLTFNHHLDQKVLLLFFTMTIASRVGRKLIKA